MKRKLINLTVVLILLSALVYWRKPIRFSIIEEKNQSKIEGRNATHIIRFIKGGSISEKQASRLALNVYYRSNIDTYALLGSEVTVVRTGISLIGFAPLGKIIWRVDLTVNFDNNEIIATVWVHPETGQCVLKMRS